MKNLLAFLAAVAVVVIFAGWYLGWYEINHHPLPDGRHAVEIEVDKKKVVEDVKRGSETVLREGREKLEKLLDKHPKAASSGAEEPAELPLPPRPNFDN